MSSRPLRPSMNRTEVEGALRRLGFTEVQRPRQGHRRSKGTSHRLWVDEQGNRVMLSIHRHKLNPEHVDNLFHTLRRLGKDVSDWFEAKAKT